MCQVLYVSWPGHRVAVSIIVPWFQSDPFPVVHRCSRAVHLRKPWHMKHHKTKSLKSFKLRDSPFGRIQDDSIHLTSSGGPVMFQTGTGFEQTEQAYILHLHNAVLIPDISSTQGPHPELPPLAPPWRHETGRTLLTHRGEIIADSFLRSLGLPFGVHRVSDHEWISNLPEPEVEFMEDCYLLDFVTRHFGHMLLETPCRQWPDAIDCWQEAFRSLTPVTVMGHGLRSDASVWPDYLLAFLKALGVDPTRIKVIEKPTRLRSLFVPKRLSPHTNYGVNACFFDLMARAGQRLAANAASSLARPDRIYLSRSGPKVMNRSALSEPEVEAIFRNHGFQILHPETLPLADQAALISSATHVAGFSGSQLHLSVFRDTPGLKLFRIAPRVHNPPWDERAGVFTGTEVTTFELDIEGVRDRSDLVDWAIPKETMRALEHGIASWSNG